MVAVILTILKIIGMLLLCLVGIVLLVILTVLFVPVRYEAKGYYRSDYAFKFKASWCLHFLSCVLYLDTKTPFTMEIRLFGIKLKRKASKKVEQAADNEEITEDETELKQEDTSQEQMKQEEQSKIIIEKSELEESQRNESEPGFFEKLNISIQTAIQNLIHLKKSVIHMGRSFKGGMDKITFYLTLLQGDEFRAAFARCKLQILRILSNLKPRKLQINLHFGKSDEPDLVGQVLGIWGMTFPIHKGKVQVIPEFEQDILEGDFYTKGRISLYLYLWTVYIVMFDKNIKYLKACVIQED